MDQDERKAKIEKRVKVGIALVVGLLVAPVIFTAIGGLVGLIVAALIGFTAIQLAPVFAMKIANWRMKLIVQEAQKNPIETMKNLLIEKSQDIKTSDDHIVEFEGRVGDYHDKVIGFAKRFPNEAPRYQEIETKMRSGLASMKRKQVAAKTALSELKANIDKAESIYAMALAAADVTSLNKNVENQVFQDIKEQVSFDSVNHKLNTAVAQLSMEVESEDYKTLPAEEVGILPCESGREKLPIERSSGRGKQTA